MRRRNFTWLRPHQGTDLDALADAIESEFDDIDDISKILLLKQSSLHT